MPRLQLGTDGRRLIAEGQAKTSLHGIDALRQYRAEWDEKNRILKPTPVHDWASHPADGFRYLAVGLRENRGQPMPRPVVAPFVGVGRG